MLAEARRPISLAHLQRLTDCFGIIQHAKYTVPDYRSGYTTDDNARALVVALKSHQLRRDALSRELAARYLSFLLFAQREDGRFHNFVGYDRRFQDEVGSEDCFGRSLWALAGVLLWPSEPGLVGPAETMLHQALPWVERLEHPRGKALAITALHWWAQARPEEAARAQHLARLLAEDLVARYREHARPGWDWLLPDMTYANAKLPQALFRAYELTGEAEFLELGRRTLGFLCEKTIRDGLLCLVGNNGWHRLGQAAPPPYDQQPIDAASMVEACLAAFHATGEVEHARRAWICLEWFFGRNLRGEPLYDPQTGGCFDALTEHGVNRNQGAESTISLLLAQLLMLEERQDLAGRLLAGDLGQRVAEEGSAYGGGHFASRPLS